MSDKVYKPLTIPLVKWNINSLDDNFAELIAQPLEPGFGITLGNTLRRALLSIIEGSAVTSVIIEGINNEFSTLPGVIEDAMQVILNIKELVIKNETGLPGHMKLNIKGESVAKGGDIITDPHLSIVNKDHIIANVSQGGSLVIDFFVDIGRGYQLAKWPSSIPLQKDNMIYIDSIFTPIKKVSFNVEKTRVGNEIDFDKLILHIETNGALSPIDAVNYAVSVLRSQFEHFIIDAKEIPFNDISKVNIQANNEQEKKDKELFFKGIPVDLLLKPIEELELSVRAHNCLINANIKRILDLVNLTEDEGLKIKNFGRKSLNEVKDAMKSFGLHFGMNISEEDIQKLIQERQSS